MENNAESATVVVNSSGVLPDQGLNSLVMNQKSGTKKRNFIIAGVVLVLIIIIIAAAVVIMGKGEDTDCSNGGSDNTSDCSNVSNEDTDQQKDDSNKETEGKKATEDPKEDVDNTQDAIDQDIKDLNNDEDFTDFGDLDY